METEAILQHQIFPAFTDKGTNRSHRAGVTLLCEVRQGLRPWAVARLEDISEQGFRIAWLPACNPELPLRIKIPGLQLLSARIRWQEGHAFGCEFTDPLHIAVFENIVRQAVIDGPLSR